MVDTYKNLKFPLDVKDIPYEAKIKFTAREVESFDVNFLFDRVLVAGAGRGDGSIEVERRRRDTAAAAAANNGMEPEETNRGTGQILKPGNKGSAILYLPQAIQITDQAAYSNTNLGIMGGATQAAMAQGAALLPTLMSEGKDAAASIVDVIMNGRGDTRDLAKLAVNRASKMLPGQGMRGAVSSATRVSVNPNTRAIFDSVPLREFTFTFKMIPSSRAETTAITNIIKFFRENLYPEVITMGDIPAGYKFPHVFTIDLKYKDKNLATKILPSYIKTFNATYNASGMGFLSDGEGGGDFSEVDITMTFMESGTLHKQLVKDGY
jgi:hypothetical protein